MFGDHLELTKLGRGHPDVLNLGYVAMSDMDGYETFVCREGLGMNEANLKHSFGCLPYNEKNLFRLMSYAKS